jgi:quercetin dioxygenase-like cupin family protein
MCLVPASEHLILRGGDIFINLDPSNGANAFATGTQKIPVGIGIPIHRHFDMDEAFYVIEGSGSLILNYVRHRISKGASIFIPMNSWPGFENALHELVLLWTVAPAGLERFFREIATRPGAPPTERSTKQLNEIASKIWHRVQIA